MPPCTDFPTADTRGISMGIFQEAVTGQLGEVEGPRGSAWWGFDACPMRFPITSLETEFI